MVGELMERHLELTSSLLKHRKDLPPSTSATRHRRKAHAIMNVWGKGQRQAPVGGANL